MPITTSEMAPYLFVGFKQVRWWTMFIMSYPMDLTSMVSSKTTSLRGENLSRDSSSTRVNSNIIYLTVKANRRQKTIYSKEPTIKAKESREDSFGIIKTSNSFIRDNLIGMASFTVRVHVIEFRYFELALRSL